MPMNDLSQFCERVKSELLRVCADFAWSSYSLMGAYLDAIGGLELLEREIVNHQNQKIEELRATDPVNANMEFLDKAPMSHELAGNDPHESTLLHRTTLGEFKQRVGSQGLVRRRLGEMMVTLLYASWEEDHRAKIAAALHYANKDDLKSDLFGDLAQLRHAIVHMNGIATAKVSKAKILKWFDQSDVILLSVEHVHQLFGHVDSYVSQLLLERGVLEDEITACVRKVRSGNGL
jgi:hypothetical protein